MNEFFTRWIFDASVQIALLVTVIAVIVFLGQRMSARCRYALWTLVLVKALLPPFVAVPWSVANLVSGFGLRTSEVGGLELDVRSGEREVGNGKSEVWNEEFGAMQHHNAENIDFAPITSIAIQTTGSSLPTPNSTRQTPNLTLFTVWFGGVLIFWITVLACYAWAIRLLTKGNTLRDGPIYELSLRLAERLGIRRTPQLVLSDAVRSPFLWGFSTPRIAIPADFPGEVGPDEMESVLLHELTHWKRGDLFVARLELLVRSLFWFHPFVWYALYELRKVRESACDETLLASGCIAAKRYGDSLLNVMLAIREPSTVPVGFLGFLGILERKTQLHQRLEEIMSQQHHVKRIGLIGWTLLLFLTLFVLPMAVAQKETPKPEEEAEPTKDKLIDGLFAYHTLIKTGTFTYQFGTMVTESDDYSQPLPWQDKGYGTPYTAELTVADNGWVMRWPTTPIVSMYHRDYSATYTETPQPEGETYRSLIIERSGRMNKPLDEEGKNAPLYEVVKAGAVPTPQMLKYIKKHRDRIEYLGKKTVRDIETHVLQLRIPKAEIDEFKGSFHPKELKEDFIAASFYVAPSLSFAAVKIVTWTPDGVTTHRYEATDFQEVAKGIFFPMRYYSIGDFTMHGNGYYIYQYLISELKNVNQPVPESNFEIAAPAGTRVRDSRSNDDNIYYIDKDTIFFQKVPGKTASTTHSDWFQLLNQAQQNYVAWDENQFAHVYDPKNYEVGDKRDEFEAKWVKLLEGTEPGHPGFEKLHPYDEAIIGLATIKSDKAAMLLVTIAAERVLKDNAHRHYATKALGMLGDPSVVPDVIPLLYHFNMNTRWDAQIALVRLTGQNFGRDAEAWGKWYNENRETLGRNLPAFDPAPVDWTCGSNDAQLQLYSTPEKQAEVDRQFGE